MMLWNAFPASPYCLSCFFFFLKKKSLLHHPVTLITHSFEEKEGGGGGKERNRHNCTSDVSRIQIRMSSRSYPVYAGLIHPTFCPSFLSFFFLLCGKKNRSPLMHALLPDPLQALRIERGGWVYTASFQPPHTSFFFLSLSFFLARRISPSGSVRPVTHHLTSVWLIGLVWFGLLGFVLGLYWVA